MGNVIYLGSRKLVGLLSVACVLGGLFGCGPKGGSTENTTSAEPMKTPATVEQATKVLDLSTTPLMEGAKRPGSRQMAHLTYSATGDVRKGFEFHRKALLDQGWKELPNSSVTEQSASAMFSRSGFVVSLSVSPIGEPGGLMVMLINLGNVKPGQLPVPPGTKPVYVGDSTAMYSTDAAVAATAAACRDLFVAQGWVPYGNAGADTAYYKQNAILATATVSSAPAQGGKTMIQYSTQQMSADIPAPPSVEDLRYVDEPPELTFGIPGTNPDALVDFYRKTLATARWEPTLDHLVAIDEKPTMIFRNPAKDMLTLAASGAHRGKLLFSVRFQTAAEIAELDRRIKEEAPKLRAAAQAKEKKEAAELAERNKVSKVAVVLPADAKDVQQTKDSIKFVVGHGKAKAAVESFRTQFREAGWKEEVASIEAMAGTVLFSKEDQKVTITYSDTGFMPTEVSLSTMRVELERK